MPSVSSRSKVNRRVLFNDYPTGEPKLTCFPYYSVKQDVSGYPEPGKTVILDTSEAIDIDDAPLNGGVLTKLVVVSVDPYLRGLMNKQTTYRV